MSILETQRYRDDIYAPHLRGPDSVRWCQRHRPHRRRSAHGRVPPSRGRPSHSAEHVEDYAQPAGPRYAGYANCLRHDKSPFVPWRHGDNASWSYGAVACAGTLSFGILGVVGAAIFLRRPLRVGSDVPGEAGGTLLERSPPEGFPPGHAAAAAVMSGCAAPAVPRRQSAWRCRG